MFCRLIAVLFLMLMNQILANVNQNGKFPSSDWDYQTNLILSIGYPCFYGLNPLSDDYQTKLGGNKPELKASPLFSATVNFRLMTNYKMSVAVDWLMQYFSDGFAEPVKSFNTTLYRDISENLNVTTMPVLAGIDYLSEFSPYFSFVGVSGGIAYSSVQWNETVSSPKENDSRTGGKHVFNGILPAIRFKAGTELNFDKKSDRDFLKSLVAEVRFTYIARYVQFFKGLQTEDKKYNELSGKIYPLLPYYIGLYLGLSFNIGYL